MNSKLTGPHKGSSTTLKISSAFDRNTDKLNESVLVAYVASKVLTRFDSWDASNSLVTGQGGLVKVIVTCVVSNQAGSPTTVSFIYSTRVFQKYTLSLISSFAVREAFTSVIYVWMILDSDCLELMRLQKLQQQFFQTAPVRVFIGSECNW